MNEEEKTDKGKLVKVSFKSDFPDEEKQDQGKKIKASSKSDDEDDEEMKDKGKKVKYSKLTDFIGHMKDVTADQEIHYAKELSSDLPQVKEEKISAPVTQNDFQLLMKELKHIKLEASVVFYLLGY